VREDGREDNVFALIGPKKVDVPWKVLEHQGWIAKAQCHELRVPMSDALRMDYAITPKRQKFRVASENPAKAAVVREILAQLTELAADPKIRRYLLARLSDTAALVDPGQTEHLGVALLNAGHTPKRLLGEHMDSHKRDRDLFIRNDQ
jgi:hypothetical protein